MTVIIGERQDIGQGVYLKRMITCPGHYLIPPQIDIYLREPDDMFKNCPDFVEWQGKKTKIRKTHIVKDKWGNKKIDWKKLFELRRQGIVLHPKVSAAWAIEHIYDPISMLCNLCHDKPCKEGQGRILTHTIRRLNGIPMKR